MKMGDQEVRLELLALVARFANSFDLKEWDRLGECLTHSVYTDYRDLRGTPPETMAREEFVRQRRLALQELQTHHLAGNIEIEANDRTAQLRVSMFICRRSHDGELLATHCVYFLGVELLEDGWHINSIRQEVLLSNGNIEIHNGIKRR